ncbi:hypothetical protein B0T14DRAFT_344439 [Immersiella caudata]|uniref:Uncharacterized protein n=1 Tax=Immersiella caudata TaxID=314043 RepID=A0AA39W3P7_9PEZI|nr:hypothetical protein B0T14DRAFT_344439 [Immersiella caudata]
MEDFDFFPDTRTPGDPILGLNPDPGLPQPLDWHVDSVDPFYVRGSHWLPEPEMPNPYQEMAATTMGSFGITMSGQQPDVDPFPCYVDHPGFNHTTTFVFAGQDSPTLAHGYRLDIGELSIDGLGSSPTSEGLSPASQQMFPLSPLSPVAPLGLPQEPVYTEWAFSNTSNIATEVNTGLSLPLHRIGSVPPVRTRELRSRRKGSAKPGPRSQIPKYATATNARCHERVQC